MNALEEKGTMIQDGKIVKCDLCDKPAVYQKITSEGKVSRCAEHLT